MVISNDSKECCLLKMGYKLENYTYYTYGSPVEKFFLIIYLTLVVVFNYEILWKLLHKPLPIHIGIQQRQDLRTDKETKTVRQTDRQTDQSKLRGIQSECSIKCSPLKWNTEPSPGEVNVDWNKEHDPIVTCFNINRVNLLYVCSDRIYTVFHNRASENTAHVSTLFDHNTCNFFYLFTWKGLQPVFHQTVYQGVFTVLCTVLSSLTL